MSAFLHYILLRYKQVCHLLSASLLHVEPCLWHVLDAEHFYIRDECQSLELQHRCLVPKSMDGLLVASRNFSSDTVMNTRLNVIQSCIAKGHAAGTAATLAVQSNVELAKVDYQALRKRLAAQGIPV